MNLDSLTLLKPRLSEKAYKLSEELNTYVFDVPSSATAQSVANAIKKQYEVKVFKVRLARVAGKAKWIRSARGRRQSYSVGTSVKKAYVTLVEGDKLPIFAAVEEADAKPEKEKK